MFTGSIRSPRRLFLAGVLATTAAVAATLPAASAPAAATHSSSADQARVWLTTADGRDKLT